MTNSEPENILVAHVAGLGLTTLALPALRSLRKHLPRARITVAASAAAADLLRSGGCADEVLAVGRLRMREAFWPRAFYRSARTVGELRRASYDLGVELAANAESSLVLQLARPDRRLGAPSGPGLRQTLGLIAGRLLKLPPPFAHAAHDYLRRFDPLGVRPLEVEPRLAPEREAAERIENLLRKHGVEFGELLVGIHPGAGPGKQRWPAERFASVAARLIHNYQARVIVFAGPYERGLARRLVGELPARRALAVEAPKVPDLIAALSRLTVLVANHSGPAHVAAAVGTPVVAASTLAGPSAQDLLSKHHVHIRRRHASAIPEEEVYEAACRLLQRSRAEVLMNSRFEF